MHDLCSFSFPFKLKLVKTLGSIIHARLLGAHKNANIERLNKMAEGKGPKLV